MTAGINAFWTAFNSGGGKDTQLVPLGELGWETYDQRMRRYALYEAYHTNTVYTSIFKPGNLRKLDKKLYKHIRSIYNPVARQNDLLASYIYGGAIDLEHLTDGAIPLATDDEALLEALKQLFIWSRLTELKSLYVRMGTKLGDAPIWVVDEPAKGKVRLELLDPRKLREVSFDAVGNVKAAVIEYERDEELDFADFTPGKTHPLEQNPRSYIYTLVVDHDPANPINIRFRTYKDAQPYAFNEDESGSPTPEWVVPYGFVPLVIGGHESTTLHWHVNAFSHAIPKIDEANDAASLLNDQIRKSVNAVWAFTKVKAMEDVQFNLDKKDSLPFVGLPDGANAIPLVAQLQLAEALTNLQAMLMELERDMPELALQRVREQGGSFTAPGIRAAYSDAVGRIQLARSNYNEALVRALQMGVSIGGYRGYDGFQGFNLDSYERGDLEFHVKDRAVIADELTSNEKIVALGSVADKPPAVQRLMLKELNYTDDEIDDVVTEAEEQQQQQMRAAVRGMADSRFGDQTDNEGDNADQPEENT